MAVEQEHAWKISHHVEGQIIKEGGNGDGTIWICLFSGRKTMSGIPIKSSVNATRLAWISRPVALADAPC